MESISSFHNTNFVIVQGIFFPDGVLLQAQIYRKLPRIYQGPVMVTLTTMLSVAVPSVTSTVNESDPGATKVVV